MKFNLVAFLALLGFAVVAQAGEPRQGWASKDGVIQLKQNGPKVANQSALDRLMIQEAFSRWGIAYDEAQVDVVRSLFTKDAQFQVLLGSKEPIDGANGIDDIVRTVQNSLKQQNDQRRHAISNVVIDKLTSNEASAIAYGIVVNADNNLILGASVIYRGELRKETDGVWRFTKFVIGMDHYSGQPVDASKK